jgi:hypothetical protein
MGTRQREFKRRTIPAELWQEFNARAADFLTRHRLDRSLSLRYSRFLDALTVAAKVLPRGCRYDPVPW